MIKLRCIHAFLCLWFVLFGVFLPNARSDSLVVQERLLSLDDYGRPAFEETYLIDSRVFLSSLIYEIIEAQYSIYLDFYIIGGPEFDLIVDLMYEKMQAGVDVRILFDRRLGIIPTHSQYMKATMQHIVAYGIPFYLSSDQTFGTDEYGRPYTMKPVDHNKFAVVDQHVAFIGSANPIPSMEHFFDLMFLVKGKAVKRLHKQFLFDFESAKLQAQGFRYDGTRCDQPWLNEISHVSLQEVRVFSNGYCRVEIKDRLLELIDGAQQQIEIVMQELSYVPEVMDALGRAIERGVSVRVLIGVTDPTDVLYGFLGPALLPRGITVARGVYALDQMGGVIREFQLRPGAMLLHPKVYVFDQSILFGGSANLTEGGLNRVYETNVEIHKDEGIALSQMMFLFETEWEAAREYSDYGTFSRFIQYFMDEALNHSGE